MSEFMREALPIVLMYGFVLLLAPFIAFAMWMAFDGDRLRVVDEVAEAPAEVQLQAVPARAATPRTLTGAGATTAA